MILEIRIIQLRPDDSSAHDIIHRFCVHTKTHSGARYAYFGRSSEKPDTMFVFIGWDTLENSHEFASALDAANPLASLHDVANTEAILRIPFEASADPSPALGADARVKVTEIVLYHFPSPLPSKPTIMASMDKMRPVIGRSEALAVHDGWALEEMKNEKGDESTVYVNLVGWVDVDAHMRFQASEDFRGNVHWLLECEGLRGMEMWHVRLERV